MFWYRIYIKGVCDNLNIEFDPGEVPSEYDGVPVYYALTLDDAKRVIGVAVSGDEVPIPYGNVYNVDDEKLIKNHIRFHQHGFDNGQKFLAVIYRLNLWFVPVKNDENQENKSD